MVTRQRLNYHYEVMAMDGKVNVFNFDVDKVFINSIIEKYNLQSKSRDRDILFKRQYLMWWVRKNYNKVPLRTIGGMFGNRDHSTVIHATKGVDNAIKFKCPIFFANEYGVLEVINELNKRFYAN